MTLQPNVAQWGKIKEQLKRSGGQGIKVVSFDTDIGESAGVNNITGWRDISSKGLVPGGVSVKQDGNGRL